MYASNCRTLPLDLLHMVEMLNIAYGISWKLRGMSWIRNGEEVGLYICETSRWIIYAVNSRPKVLKYVRPTSFIFQMTCIVVSQKLRDLTAFECKWSYIETLCWRSILTAWILCIIVEHTMTDCMSLRWASTEHQRFRVWSIQQSNGCIVTSIQRGSIRHLHSSKSKSHAPCAILEMSVNRASTIFGLASWAITGLCNGIHP